MRFRSSSVACALALIILSGAVCAQNPNDSAVASPDINAAVDGNDHNRNYDLSPGTNPENRLVSPFVKHLAQDQIHFWTFPTRLHERDWKWLVPAAAGTAGLIVADSWISRQIPNKPNQLNRSKTISDYGVYSMIAAGGGAFLLGEISKNDHMRETGLLAAEAAIGATGAAYAIKFATERERPYAGNEAGEFLSHAPSSNNLSFPSEHSAIAWSIAGIMAHEYPGPLTELAAYGLATTVTLTRVTAHQHFASDAVIGGVLGWYFAHQIYRARHDPEIGGTAWGDEIDPPEGPKQRNPKNMSSPYVPPDSWVYPLFDRLAGLGVVQTAYEGIRPWTRMECARLVEEAGDSIQEFGEDSEVAKIHRQLANEFAPELGRLNGEANVGVSLDSVYARATDISGTPLTDGYHFAQTITNDYGRPYSAGFNSIAGLSAHAVAGPLSFAFQGEYQHSPAVPSYSPTVQQAIAMADATAPFPFGRSAINRFDVLNSTVSVQFNNFQASFGKQSEWWSMTRSGPFLLSDNAEPILALTLDNVSPYHIPLLSRILGDARSEYFLGRLDGHTFELNQNTLLGPGNIQPQPFLQGVKINFKPTENFEFGAGFTAMFVGPGLPFTFHNFLRTFYSHTSQISTNPGKRITSFDFSYRIPGLRNWLTIYRDSLAVDEYTPLTSSRPSMDIGLYMPRLPKLHKMDFRAEVVGTPHTHEFAPGFVYWDFRRYRSGYTNDGNLLASWIGRAGRGGQGWLTYWFSPRSTLQFGYRYQKVDRDFLEGGHLDDFTISPQIMLRHDVMLSGTVQYEHWYFPLLSFNGQSNTTAQLQLTFFPHIKFHK